MDPQPTLNSAVPTPIGWAPGIPYPLPNMHDFSGPPVFSFPALAPMPPFWPTNYPWPPAAVLISDLPETQAVVPAVASQAPTIIYLTTSPDKMASLSLVLGSVIVLLVAVLAFVTLLISTRVNRSRSLDFKNEEMEEGSYLEEEGEESDEKFLLAKKV
ncbi:hypothetical protein HDU98_002848 [Podochytrium sp. JEL0797]|nr:hypothetical protein HDU98_002848 [Podochytrium sp. JEL0797]